MNTEQLIQSIPDWHTLSATQLWTAINTKSVKKVDQKKWKSIDLAKLIGWDNVDNFFVYLSQNKCQWVVDLAAGDGLAIGDDPINTVLKGFDNPVCKQLAEIGIHYVTPMQDAGIESTQEEVASVLSTMQKQIDLIMEKDRLESVALDRLQAYREALTNWPGPPTPPPVM